MPKDTFDNLPADKRARFVDAALDEFCARPYDQASVTTIVARLGIAKGSVYQYFEDKLDLFRWLVEEAGRRKQAALAEAPPLDGPPLAEGGFFARLRAMYRDGLAFWQRDTRWARVGLRMLEPTNEPRLEALRRGYHDQALAWMRSELRAARDTGELRPDVDLDVTAPIVLAVLQDGLLRALLARAGADLGDADAPERLAAVPPDALFAIADTAVTLLEGGLGRPAR